MALDFDEFPINDRITDGQGNLSGVWRDFFATHGQTLIDYLSQFSMNPPRLTTVQRDSIQEPQNGIIYNTTLEKLQGYENGAWVNLV